MTATAPKCPKVGSASALTERRGIVPSIQGQGGGLALTRSSIRPLISPARLARIAGWLDTGSASTAQTIADATGSLTVLSPFPSCLGNNRMNGILYMAHPTDFRELSPDGFRARLRDCFGNGERMSAHIAGLSKEDWPRRLARPCPKTCRSWINGHSDPRLSQIVYLLRQMRRIERARDERARSWRNLG